MVDLESVFAIIQSYDVVDVFLPFLLIFSLVFFIVSMTRLFKTAGAVVVGAVMGLAVVIPHVLGKYPPCGDIVDILNLAIPRVGIMMLIIVSFLILVVIIGLKIDFFKRFLGWFLMAVIVFIVYTFFSSGGEGCFGEGEFVLIPYLEYIIPIVLLIVIILLLTREKGGSDADVY
jgi:hypothetical protein